MTDLYEQLELEIRDAQRLILAVVDDLDDEQFAWRPGATTPSIGFHLWHTARWADNDRDAISGDGQVWRTDGYAGRWHLTSSPLGENETGTGLSDDEAPGLVLPGKRELQSYAAAVFAGTENLLVHLAREQLAAQVRPTEGQQLSVQALLFVHLTHMNRNLGMIEAIKGLQGLRGTATR